MLDWFKKMWMPLTVIAAAMIICGPCAKWCADTLGAGFAGIAIVVDNLSAVCLLILVLDFIFDCRTRWGIFPTLDIDTAIDTAIRGSEYTKVDGSTGRLANPLSCAFVFIGVVGLVIAVLFLCVPGAHASTLDNARPYLPVLTRSVESNWPGAPLPHIAAGQIEQESSWHPHATLKTSRELGRGLVQMTIAYDKSGRERFNIYREATRYRQLQAWDWQRDPFNVPNQMTFLILQDHANFNQVRPYSGDAAQAWKCALVCYNAGEGRWLQRLRNARRQGLPTDRWDGGLDRAYSKGETALLYGRPLYVAVNEYPAVIFRRAAKYQGLV